MKIQLNSDDLKVCKINNKDFPNRNKNAYLKETFNITFEEYLIKYYMNGQIPKCQCGCGTPVKIKFYKNAIHYSLYTKNHFPRNPHSDKTKEKIKKNTKKSIKEKYGVENVFILKTIKEKIKETNKQRYGVENPMQNDSIKNKNHHYHSENTINKIKETNQLKYNSNSYTQSDIGKYKIKNIFIDRYGKENPMQDNSIKNKVFNTNIKNIGYKSNFDDPEYRRKHNIKTSKIEKNVFLQLENAEHKFIYNNKEFDMKVGDDIFEIEGDFFHPYKLENLTLIQINSLINDKVKYDMIRDSKYQLYKIHVSNLPDIITYDKLKDVAYFPNYNIGYYDIIINKKYIKKYIDTKGPEKLEKYVPIILKFVRTFQSEFPFMECKENINNVIKYISNYDYSNTIIKNKINNNISNIGINYLKSNFHSYWKSSYSDKKSPYDAWYDDNIMMKIIKYRIGLNNSNEVFNFSLNQIIRGMSAYRYTVSFFKPLLAAIIYKYFINTDTPTVIDTCAGFGGRLLGFKSIFPKGKYIGIEPNIETFNELKRLSENFNNVELYNCKLEDYTGNKECDLTFTSIPYFNNEVYSDNINQNYNDWKNMVNCLIENYNNVLINISETSYNLLKFDYNKKYLILNNTSHFNKNFDTKHELLLKIY